MKWEDLFAVFCLCVICVIFGYAMGVPTTHAQTPPTITQLLNGYPPAFVLYWSVGTTPPQCNVTLPNGSPGPPLYAMAIRQGPPDTVMVCLVGSAGMPEWVAVVTAP